MRKLVLILLSVALVLAGCGNKKADVMESVTEQKNKEHITVEDTQIPSELLETSELTETVDLPQEEVPEEKPEQTSSDIDKEVSEDTPKAEQAQVAEESPKEKLKEESAQNEQKAPAENTDDSSQKAESNEPADEPEQKQEVAYSPQTVVALATAKTKAAGKVLLTENLDRLLAEGQISKEEYKEYYPYDGAGYFSVFVQMDLNQASTTSGERLGSEDGIAQYIAELLALENGPYFFIEYAGTYDNGGTNCYEFRCYRA